MLQRVEGSWCFFMVESSRARSASKRVLRSTSFAAAATLAFLRAASAETVVDGGNVGGQVWTPTGSPYFVRGDITVQPGSSLTIEAGTVVEVADGDMQGSGRVTETEFFINGSLFVNGTNGSVATIRARNGTAASTWWGIIVSPGAAAVAIRGARIQHATIGIESRMTGSPLSINTTSFETNGEGIHMLAGTGVFDRLLGINNVTMIDMTGTSTATLSNSVIRSQTALSGNGVYTDAGGTASIRIVNCTLDRNYNNIVFGGAAANEVVNTIATNGIYGIYCANAPTVTTSYSNIWGNSTDTRNAPCTTCLSANPQYVSSTDLHLQASSVSIDSGAAPAMNPLVTGHDFENHVRPVNGDGVADADGSEY
ncbi:MAG TPA: right-handed parallel beta-helix repeat-containing protein, partial [Polyangiaceae bacterium]